MHVALGKGASDAVVQLLCCPEVITSGLGHRIEFGGVRGRGRGVWARAVIAVRVRVSDTG